MDERVQAAEDVDPGGDEGLGGGIAQPRAEPQGPRGRPKKHRPSPPELNRDLAVVLRHFFPELSDWLGQVEDPRRSGKAVFPMKVLLLLGALMFLGHSGSRNHFNDRARDAREMARTLSRLLGCAVDVLPHLDTLETVLRRTTPAAAEIILAKMIRRLIRMKALDDWRIGGRFPLAVDGTGLHSFRHRHCENCIEAHHPSGAVTYSHNLLVAFLAGGDGYALPIACELVENPGLVYDKQDCEIKAFHRLERKIRELYPQTRFHLLLDGLYADQRVMRQALENDWTFAITFKESDMPALWREAQSLLALAPGQARTVFRPGGGTLQTRWVNDLDYQGMALAAIFQVETDKDGHVAHSFAHLCADPIDPLNAGPVAAAARMRWRCENEGFNVLKNGGFALEHVYSRNRAASQAYVGFMLIAHLVQQLLTRGLLATEFKSAFKTFLNYGIQMLEALLSRPLPQNLDPPGQIRLSTA